jgi:predicted RNA binding protein YcfA (HicA-like mRNA interferase family)
MTYQELKRKLRRPGFDLLRNRGSDEFWGDPERKLFTSIARHRGEVPPGTLSQILKDLGLQRRDIES